MDREQEIVIEELRSFIRKYGIDMAVVFGSFARGETHQWSDIDILLVSNSFEGKKNEERHRMFGLGLHEELHYRYPLDILCYSRNEFDIEKENVTIVREAVREGIVVLP